MQTPGLYDIQIRTNTTYSQPLTLQDSGGNVIDLHAYSAKLQIRKQDGTLAYQLDTTVGQITLASTSPNVTWALTVAQIATIPPGRYSYDFVLYSGAGFTGTETCWLTGIVTVTQGVTQ